VFDAALNALVQLSSVVGEVLLPHLKTLLPHVSRRFMDKTLKERIVFALQQIERNCGRVCLNVHYFIHSKNNCNKFKVLLVN
jgi:hypothetical protein